MELENIYQNIYKMFSQEIYRKNFEPKFDVNIDISLHENIHHFNIKNSVHMHIQTFHEFGFSGRISFFIQIRPSNITTISYLIQCHVMNHYKLR